MSSLAPAVADVPAAPADRRWWVLFTILAVEVMDLLDGTVVNVAAPAMRASLGASLSALQWVTGGYALAFAVGLVTAGRLGDMLGRRRLFLLGVAGFTVSSAACGLATSIEALIVCRIVQGLFAASMIPQGFGIVKEVFPPEELGKAFGLFGPVIGGSAILGPIVGGVLVDANLLGAGWRMIFFVNLPIGIAALLAGSRLIPRTPGRADLGFDLTGALLVSAAAASLVTPLIQGPELDWPAWTFALFAAGAVCLAAFIAVERRRDGQGKAALVPLKLFSARAFSAGLAVALAFFGAVIGFVFLLSLYLQLGNGYSAIRTGLAIAPFALGTAIGSGVGAGALAPRIGRHTLHLGAALLIAGIVGVMVLVNHLTGPVTILQLALPELLCGLGMGSIIAPLFGFVLAEIPEDMVGSASGVLNAVQQLGAAAGIAGLGTVFFSVLRRDGFRAFAPALTHALWVELALLAVVAGLMFFLPMKARDEEAHGGN